MRGLWLAVILALTFQTPPGELEAAAAKLRRPGAQVDVGRKDDGPGWEIWFDFEGKASNEAFAKLHDVPKLGAIRFLGGGFDDRGVSKLKNLPDLHLLVLFSDRLTDKCLEPIALLSGLKKLDLGYARLSAKGFKTLAKLPKLERLYLYNARFDDGQAAPLKALTGLKILDLPSNLSASTVRMLRAALPKTEVIQRNPTPR